MQIGQLDIGLRLRARRARQQVYRDAVPPFVHICCQKDATFSMQNHRLPGLNEQFLRCSPLYISRLIDEAWGAGERGGLRHGQCLPKSVVPPPVTMNPLELLWCLSRVRVGAPRVRSGIRVGHSVSRPEIGKKIRAS